MNNEVLSFTKAISDETRLRILNYLKSECCVGELWEKLDLPQNLVSHHLKVLRDSELVIAEKRGLKVVYRLNEAILAKRLNNLSKYLK